MGVLSGKPSPKRQNVYRIKTSLTTRIGKRMEDEDKYGRGEEV